MTLAAVILLLISAATHAGWNLLGKRQHPTTAFFLLANTLGCLYMAPVFALYGRALGAFPAQTWTLLALTGLCDAAYYAALAGAYRVGELSIAYPLARSLPVVIVALATRALGQGSPLSGLALWGIALIVMGSLLLPTKSLAELSLELLAALQPPRAPGGPGHHGLFPRGRCRAARLAPGSGDARRPCGGDHPLCPAAWA